jgi:hypothetical protein
LTPLAVSAEIIKNDPSPFGVNEEFLDTLRVFADSKRLSPLLVWSLTGEPKEPDINTIVGYEYLVEDGKVYVVRRAEDCGDDEYRTEKVYVSDVLPNSYLFYGDLIPSGSQAQGGGG